ncbi:N-Acetyl-D-glucosamine ABC transport system, permease protein 1 [hydrothermal vent metagenome]|uniref:N-Acetyl-D-glucosamine ABC transport system, permease protein 1 n=1 Tax=hydrothermal vent metagenome TaxID=652676 RepID=A0A3B0TBR0_9ZZZZ
MTWLGSARRWWVAFLAPSFALLAIFTIVPIAAAGVLSLFQWDLLTDPEFVGLGNFAELARDRQFRSAVVHTLVFIAGYLPVVMVVGLSLALLLNRRSRLAGVSRVVFFMPVVSAWVAVALMWRWMLNSRFGVINWMLGLIGIEGPQWLFERGWAMVSVIGVSVWKDAGFVMILFLAGLQAIPTDCREAAFVDGANPWQTFWKVTLPLLTPTVFLVSVILLINSFQVFEQVWILTGGGPLESTTVVVEQIVRNAFSFGRMGYAAAMSWILFAFIFTVTLIQTRLQRRWVHYGG